MGGPVVDAQQCTVHKQAKATETNTGVTRTIKIAEQRLLTCRRRDGRWPTVGRGTETTIQGYHKR